MNTKRSALRRVWGANLLAVCALLALGACGDGGGGGGGGATVVAEPPPSSTYATEILPIGDPQCPAGGVSIDYGIDSNTNGELDEDEVAGTAVICNGETGAIGLPGEPGVPGEAVLVTATALALYDATCPAGGVELAYGLDNGDGGGTAGNVALEPGEVDGTTPVCNGMPALLPKPIDPPVEPLGAYTIDTHGGVESPDTEVGGGDGGSVTLEMTASGATGHVKLFATGQADASFDFPAEVTTYLGSNPLLVDEPLTIPACDYWGLDGHSCVLTAGQVHTHMGDSTLYVFASEPDDEPEAITGIHVAPGATLTFEMNDVEGVTAWIAVRNDVRNEGTITTTLAEAAPDRVGLDLRCDVFYGSPASLIDLTGADGVGTDPGDGGSLRLQTAATVLGGPRYGTGAFFNEGTIDTSSGSSEAAECTPGDAGSIDIFANLGFYNTGAVTAAGGSCTSGAGGNGGQVTFDTWWDGDYHATIHNAGAITTRGGNGANGSPGAGGSIWLGAHGHILNSGLIDAHGGSTDSGSQAGDGGAAELHAYGGRIVNDADVLLYGGDGVTAGAGGDGYDLIVTTETSTGWLGENQPAGDIVLSGNIDLHGGDGAWGGGRGGSVLAQIDATDAPMGQEIILLGYQQITLDGGAGMDYPGDAGWLTATNGASVVTETGLDASTSATVYVEDTGVGGGVYNHVPISAVGGGSVDWYGGNGGTVKLLTNTTQGWAGAWQTVANHADIVLSGGDGYTGGGGSGHLMLWGYRGAENHGAVTSIGGTATGPDGWGGSPAIILADGIGLLAAGAAPDVKSTAAEIAIIASPVGTDIGIIADMGPATNTAAIMGDGGASIGAGGVAQPHGGDAHLVEIVGVPASNSGAISVQGGDATVAGEGGIGGAGGTVFIHSLGGSSTDTGSIAIGGGAGDVAGGGEDGPDGSVYMDGMNLTELYLP